MCQWPEQWLWAAMAAFNVAASGPAAAAPVAPRCRTTRQPQRRDGCLVECLLAVTMVMLLLAAAAASSSSNPASASAAAAAAAASAAPLECAKNGECTRPSAEVITQGRRFLVWDHRMGRLNNYLRGLLVAA